MSHLGQLFRNRRFERNLSLGELAGRLGYQNVSKGANKISAFEAGGKVHPDLLAKLAEVLEITADEIQQRLHEDYQAWLTWANEPMRPLVVVRLLACVYQRVQIPDNALQPEAAEAFAAKIALEERKKTWLVLSRRVSIYFDVDGNKRGRIEATPDMPCEPFVTIGGRRVQFDFEGGIKSQAIDESGK